MQFAIHYLNTLMAYWANPFVLGFSPVVFFAGRHFFAQGLYGKYAVLYLTLTIYSTATFVSLW